MFSLPFGRDKERYLIVELSPERERALWFDLDREKRLVFRREWEKFSVQDFTRRWNFSRKKLNVIVVVDETAAFEVKIPVELKRASREHLAAAELENILGQTVSRVFNQHREQARDRKTMKLSHG